MNPTKEQIQWFWEQCGFKLVPAYGGTNMSYTRWLYPEGDHYLLSPPIDLNNLFKYAIPEGSCVSFADVGSDIITCILADRWTGYTTSELGVTQGKGNTESLALFWARYKALEVKE